MTTGSMAGHSRMKDFAMMGSTPELPSRNLPSIVCPSIVCPSIECPSIEFPR